MKIIAFYMLLVCLVFTSTARPIFMNRNDIGDPTFKTCVAEFLKGFEIDRYATPTEECLSTSDSFSQQIQEGLNLFTTKEFYNGTVELTEALSIASPLSRDCYEFTHKASTNFINWQNSFKSLPDFMSKISVNTMKNLKYIKKDFGLMLANYMASPNLTYISGLAGEITRLTFVLEKEDPLLADYIPLTPLGYHPTDPLASSPITKGLWSVLEGAFKFLLNSKSASLEATQDCQEGSINLVYFNQHAYQFHSKGKSKDAYFTFADGLGFSRQAFEGCTTMVSEFGTTFKKVIHGGHIGDNIKSNIVSIISGGMGTWAELYHKDWISLLGVLGDLTFKIFVHGAN